jgi:PAS domain S-box-containing protein
LSILDAVPFLVYEQRLGWDVALFSILLAIMVWRILFPTLTPLDRRQLQKLNRTVQVEIQKREEAEQALRRSDDELERRVGQRTRELLTANRSLERSEWRYRALVQASSQIVWARDADGTSVDPADSWCRFTGQRPEEAKRLGWLDAVHPDDRERTRRLWLQAVREKTEYVNEYQLRRADGAYRWMSIRGVPIVDRAGAVREWIGMNTDITEATQASLALRQALHDVKEKQGQLVQAGKLASLGELTTGIAHELNNPLNNISLYIGNVVEGWAERGQHAADRHMTQLKSALREVQRAATIIAHLRAFGRQAGTKREPLAVNEVVRSAVELVRHQLQLQTIAVHIELDSDEPVLQANRLQLEQVLVNLLTNARDAVGETVLKEIHLRTVSHTDRVEIRVSDSGSGIDPEIQPRIFDPFFTSKEVGQGTGLGLSISYGIIKDHGGDIHVMSDLGRGTTFVLQFPIGASASHIARKTAGTLVAP